MPRRFTARCTELNVNAEDMARDIESAVLDATQVIETLEAAGLIVGNGWHIRQDIAKYAKDKVLERWRNKV